MSSFSIDFEVRDHTVSERPHDLDVRGGPTKHGPRGLPDGDDGMAHAIQGDDGRLGDDDSLPANEQERVGGAEVDPDIAGEHPGRQAKLHA
jgi:hypothetical protein